MEIFKTVVPFEAPSEILSSLHDVRTTEMIDSERAFLCGLLQQYRPKKIVEVGVAEGGTTAVMLNCVHEISLECDMYSVDLAERYYGDPTKETGWILKEAARTYPEKIDLSKHHLLLGDVLPAHLENIGGGIDFLLLDTMHRMPGEVLDFIAAFPYLDQNAIVVLHDVNFSYGWRTPNGIATTVLFQSVVADKFLNNQDFYPNIAAFKLNSDTDKYMCNVFTALITTWSYLPEEKHLEEYRTITEKHYPPEYMRIYCQAIQEAKQFYYPVSSDAAPGSGLTPPGPEPVDDRSNARKFADKVLPKGSRRREFAKIFLPKGSLRYRFCKKIYHIIHF